MTVEGKTSSRYEIWKYLQYSMSGAIRCTVVGPTIYPLEVIKVTIQENLKKRSIRETTRTLWHAKGIQGFYRGYSFFYRMSLCKQVICWPIVLGLPSKLTQNFSIDPLHSQIITGVFTATVDSVLFNRWERSRLSCIVDPIVLRKRTWKLFDGVIVNCLKSSVNWVTVIVSQDFFRKRFRAYTGRDKLTTSELGGIGVLVASTVSLVGAPFDLLNTLRLTGRLEIRHSWSLRREIFPRVFPTLRLLFFMSVLHNIGTVFLIDRVGPKFDRIGPEAC